MRRKIFKRSNESRRKRQIDDLGRYGFWDLRSANSRPLNSGSIWGNPNAYVNPGGYPTVLVAGVLSFAATCRI